jgi:hypothetical protein
VTAGSCSRGTRDEASVERPPVPDGG